MATSVPGSSKAPSSLNIFVIVFPISAVLVIIALCLLHDWNQAKKWAQEEIALELEDTRATTTLPHYEGREEGPPTYQDLPLTHGRWNGINEEHLPNEYVETPSRMSPLSMHATSNLTVVSVSAPAPAIIRTPHKEQ
ncbi:hypothetical protein DV736_g3811, partial [Chaetothyriales sp. CBS 134916]